MSKPVWSLDASGTASLVKKKQMSVREVVTAHLARLDTVNPALNAVVRVLRTEALAEADAADAAIARGDDTGPLHGVPITTKINTDQAGCPTDNGVSMLKDMMATQDAPQIANLRKAGAIVIGRTNSPAFAMRAVTDNALHGLTLNPWNNKVTCGGSSGGAGASLAAGIGALAQGNDIGGSIRWPSYCNGVAGLRPSVGRVPAFNATATASRAFAAQIMSVNGPMARSVRDLQLGLRVMAKGDPRDPAWIPAPIDPPPLQAPLQVAVAMDETLDPGIKAAMRRAASHLSGAGYEVEEIAPPDIERVAGLWAEIGLTEIAAMLNPVLPNIGDRGILSFISNFWQLKGHGDLARYMAALREREALLTRWQVFMETWPLIILPACSEPSLPVGIDEQGPAQAERLLNALKYQLVLPVLGLPAVALPTGLHNDLPMGIQIMSRKFREDLCLDAAAVIERQEAPITPIDARW